MRTQIHGDIPDGYGPVADVFAATFAQRDELRAAVTVYVGGRKVDPWGGLADERVSMGGAFGSPLSDRQVTFNAPDIQAAEIPARTGW